jgi:hypothetical protein
MLPVSVGRRLLSDLLEHGRHFPQSIGPDVAADDSGAIRRHGQDDVMNLEAERLHPPADQGVCIAHNFLDGSDGILHPPTLAQVQTLGRRIPRPPRRPVDPPSDGLPAPRALEALVAVSVHHRPWRLVDRHMVDLPWRQACPAGKESEVVVAADRQQHRWLDLDRPGTPADVASVPSLGAAESGRRETAIAKMISGLVDWAMLIAARAVDLRLESERSDLAERREGEGMEHPPKGRHRPAKSQPRSIAGIAGFLALAVGLVGGL